MAKKRKTPNVGYIRPEVMAAQPDWAMVEDAVAGSRRVKAAGEKYLPKPVASMDKAQNDELYEKYVERACFYPVVGKSLHGMSGEVYAKEPTQEIPDLLSPLVENIDGNGVSFKQQVKSTLGAVLKHGRGGLLADFPALDPDQIVTQADIESGKIRPRILRYRANQIINWGHAVIGGESLLSLLVLVESTEDNTGDEFEADKKLRWRVYRLRTETTDAGQARLAATVEVWEVDTDLTEANKDGTSEYKIIEDERRILQANQEPFPFIPFQFIGSVDNDATVDPAPLLDIASLNIAHYRNSADAEHTSYYAGQPTPVFTGLTQEWVDDNMKGGVFFGSSHALPLPVGASAQLLQASPNTLPEAGMERKEAQMRALGARLIEAGGVQRTAFEAGVDKAGEVSVLANVAGNVSAAYRAAFYNASLFISPVERDAVEFELNTQYDFGGMTVQEVVDSWMKGLVSKPEARDNLRRKGANLGEDSLAEEQIRADGVDI